MTIRAMIAGSTLFRLASQRFALRSHAIDNAKAYRRMNAPRKKEREKELRDVTLAAVINAHMAVEASLNELFATPGLMSDDRWFPGLARDAARERPLL